MDVKNKKHHKHKYYEYVCETPWFAQDSPGSTYQNSMNGYIAPGSIFTPKVFFCLVGKLYCHLNYNI